MKRRAYGGVGRGFAQRQNSELATPTSNIDPIAKFDNDVATSRHLYQITPLSERYPAL
jgi:hypothetical protein